METQSSPASPATSAAPRAESPDWRPSPGLIDRMLAYRDWWNIPQNRTRSGAAKNRTRSQERAG